MKGIVLSSEDKVIQAHAKAIKLPVTVDITRPFAYEKTLFMEPGVKTPWDLLPAAWHFLEHWDAAVPLWRYVAMAEKVGTEAEREATKFIVRDLRCLLYAWELLFVRQSKAGCMLVEAWKKEYAGGGEKRLAFLRAFYQVKPRVCVLPVTWLADVQASSKQALKAGKTPQMVGKLMVVELEPGRFVKCHPGDEQRVKEHFKKTKIGQRIRRK